MIASARIMHQYAAFGDSVEVFALDGHVVDAVLAGDERHIGYGDRAGDSVQAFARL